MFQKSEKVLAISMWDISWLELHGKGEAFENWELRVKELRERGYDVVRIDPYIHLLSLPDEQFYLEPVWADYGWGATKPCYVSHIFEQLVEFMKICQQEGILVAFSAWYRHCEKDNYVSHITDGTVWGSIWVSLMDRLKEEQLLESIYYVDFCNEYPLWAEFLPEDKRHFRRRRDCPEIMEWTRRCTETFKESYPDIPTTFSLCSEFCRMQKEDFSDYDFFEPHIWIDSDGDGRFEDGLKRYMQDTVVSQEELFLIKKEFYEDGKEYWDEVLHQQIHFFGNLSRKWNKPLITTECWAIVFYLDSPVGWDWIKGICEKGVSFAIEEMCYAAIATSNFCSPQFKGMWEDLKWHQKMTEQIHKA